MKKGIGDDKMVRINPLQFWLRVSNVIEIQKDVCQAIYKFFIKIIHDEIQCGNIVHLEGLGYFHLIMLDIAFCRKHEKQGNVDSEVMVMPCFQSTTPVTSRYTKMFGENNVIDGINIINGYRDKLGKTHKANLDDIIERMEHGKELIQSQDELVAEFDRKIEKYQRIIKELKNDKKRVLREVYRKDSKRRQSAAHELLSE